MNYYIADTHFGHESVLRFDNRPFCSIEENDRTLIEYWNARVTNNDHIYIIGDFAYRNEKPEEWYLKRLSGKKHLIIGNHDQKLLKNEAAMKYFETVEKMMHVSDGRHQICLCHYPLAEWYGFYKGHYHIYGHIHNSENDIAQFMHSRKRALNAGCMVNGYMPVTFEELVQNRSSLDVEETEER